MASVLSFVCTTSKSGWTAKCCNKDDVEEISADDRWSLEKLLKEASISHATSAGGLSSAFSWITPKTAIYQFTIGGGAIAVVAGSGGGGGGGGGEAKKVEEKEPEEEESDDSDSGGMLDLFG